MTSTSNEDSQVLVFSRPTYGSSDYVPGERDALNGSGIRRKRPKRSPLLIAFIAAPVILLFLIVPFLLFEASSHLINGCPLSYTQRTLLREESQRELAAQLRLRREWQREKQDQEGLRIEWALEEKHHYEELERRRIHEREYEDQLREDWDRELKHHLEHQEEQRRQWEIERESHEHEMERRRRAWQNEVDEHNRLEEERRRREKEERQKMNMFWGEVEKHQCTTYATREYTALLENLPADYAYRVEACKEIPFEIHGVSYLPTECEDKGPGIVLGRWEVNQHEADCVPFWNWYKDKGCTSVGSGKRRIEQYLENLPRGADWREFCTTTPASFLGMHFTGAQICFQYDLGTYGHWEIDDFDC